MTAFSRQDYTHVADIIRRHSVEEPASRRLADDEYFRQLALERIVDDFSRMFREDNRNFDENRFRMAALGYVQVEENVEENGE